MKNISEHITYNEATRSITAKRNNILNTPNKAQLKNMRLLAENVLEPLRAGLGGKPIYCVSFFRSKNLNSIVGGAINSQHMAEKGAAVDVDNDGREDSPSNDEVFHYIKDNLEFDQLIWEYGTKTKPDWVHVSYNKGKNRKQILRCRSEYPKYIPFK